MNFAGESTAISTVIVNFYLLDVEFEKISKLIYLVDFLVSIKKKLFLLANVKFNFLSKLNQFLLIYFKLNEVKNKLKETKT